MSFGQVALVLCLVTVHGCLADADNCWVLVFRGLSGIGQQVYKAWTKALPKACTLQNGCIPNNVDLTVVKTPNNTHLKSPKVANWAKLDISKVKIEFHTNKRVMYMVFNGTKSTYTNWFTKPRLLESSFNDLYSDGCLKYMAMTGYYAKKFIVSQEGYTCTSSYYWWMTVVENRYTSASARCSWENHGKYPVFVYAPKHHKSRFANKDGHLTADTMTIYIMTGNG